MVVRNKNVILAIIINMNIKSAIINIYSVVLNAESEAPISHSTVVRSPTEFFSIFHLIVLVFIFTFVVHTHQSKEGKSKQLFYRQLFVYSGKSFCIAQNIELPTSFTCVIC